MTDKRPSDIIEKYRRGQERRFPITWGDVAMFLVVLAGVLAVAYVSVVGVPDIPVLKFLEFPPTATATILAPPTATESIPPTATAPQASPVVTSSSDSGLTVLPTATLTATETATPRPTETPMATATDTATLTATPIPTIEYKVQEGDTLSSIAAKYGVTVQEIIDLNGIVNPSIIVEGQMLKIPVKKTE